jgi:hypothetical protein
LSVLPDHDHKTMTLFPPADAAALEELTAVSAPVVELLSALGTDDVEADEAASPPREPAHPARPTAASAIVPARPMKSLLLTLWLMLFLHFIIGH